MPGLPDSVLAAGLALFAAFCGALGSVLQARVVLTRVPNQAELRPQMLLTVVRSPMWLAGVLIAGFGFGFHATALAQGTLVEVEPILVLALVFALPLGAWLCRQPVGRTEWLAALAVVGGLLVFLLSADPIAGTRRITPLVWLVIVGSAGLAMVVCVVGSRRTARPATAALLLGVAAAVGLAVGALLMKGLANQVLRDGFVGLLDWRLAVLAVGGFVVLLVQQSAYRAGPFAAALSPMIGLNPILAGVLGVVAYGDRVHDSVGRTLMAGLGVLFVGVGLYRLSRAPAITLDEFQSSTTLSS